MVEAGARSPWAGGKIQPWKRPCLYSPASTGLLDLIALLGLRLQRADDLNNHHRRITGRTHRFRKSILWHIVFFRNNILIFFLLPEFLFIHIFVNNEYVFLT